MKSYLLDRKVRVKVDGHLSDWSENGYINAGVPQGSVLGPLLFLIYINDLPDNLEHRTCIYADDTSLFIGFDKNRPLESLQLQNDLIRLSQWATTWRMTFKAEKSADIVFTSPRGNIQNIPSLLFNNEVIPSKTNQKHLGMTLDRKLKFADHVEILADKLSKTINPMRKLANILTTKHLETIYQSFILPLIDYGDIIYNAAPDYSLLRLDQIHYQAACIVSGCIKGSNKIKVFKNLN